MRNNYKTGTTLSTSEWIEVLQNTQLTKEIDIKIFQAIFAFEGHKATSSQVGLLLGFRGKSTSAPINSEIGHYGKRVAKKYTINFTVRSSGKERKWDLFFDGYNEPPLFIWQLKKELVEALIETGLTGDKPLAEEIPNDNKEVLFEGSKRTITVNSFERNFQARQSCIKFYGSTCAVCEFSFEKTYGVIGKDFIHVHHLIPISQINKIYEVNPIKDLRPVCPNCHSMLHAVNPPLTIEELKYIIKNVLIPIS